MNLTISRPAFVTSGLLLVDVIVKRTGWWLCLVLFAVGCSAATPGTSQVDDVAGDTSPGATEGASLSPPEPTGRTRVVLLGTGTPGAEPDRSGPATAVVVDETAYLIDFGPGVVRQAAAAAAAGVTALRPPNLRIGFLTHLHSDHTAGYPDVVLTPWVLGRRAPLTVYGPPGLRAMTRSILEAYQADIRIRTEGAEMLATGGVQVQANEIEPGVVYEDALVTVEAFAVPHGTWEHAFGYKFTTVDRTVVISGDSGPNDELATIARDADILVHEAYGAFGFFQRRPQAQGYHGTFHTSATKVGEIASQANVGMVVLTHQLHLAGESPDQLVDEVRAQYNGPVVYGNDLDVF